MGDDSTREGGARLSVPEETQNPMDTVNPSPFGTIVDPQTGITTSHYYRMADGTCIPYDPNSENPTSVLPGPVVSEIPEVWEPACEDTALQRLYGGDKPDLEYFKDVQYLPLGGTYMMAPGAGMPFMDPYGILNPAAMPPVNPLAPKARTRYDDTFEAPARPKNRLWCC